MDKHPSTKDIYVVLDVKTGGVMMVSAPDLTRTGWLPISQRELNFLVSSGQWMFSDLASTAFIRPAQRSR